MSEPVGPERTTPEEVSADEPVGPDWFTEARFGLFVHWGLYSLAARHEWVKQREALTDGHYDRYLEHFAPDRFDPAAWARTAKAAGMRYVVLTTKHHDGFCLFDSDLTDYKATRVLGSPDLVRLVVDAFRAEGLQIGLYHSLIDWHHPEFPIDEIHPQWRDDAARERPRDLARYVEYLHGQVRELLTHYGRIDYLFFDFSYAGKWQGGKGADDWRSKELLAMVRELQPNILVNDRTGLPGDVTTPEQYQPAAPVRVDGRRVRWEVCQTFNGSWGYDRDNTDWKPADLLVRMLVDTVSKGGNLLLNVGPDGRGRLEPRALERFRAIGAWMELHDRSIHGCTDSAYVPPPDCRYTQRGDRLYLHVFAWPFGHLHLPGLAGKVTYAHFLHDASEVAMADLVAESPVEDHLGVGGLPPGTLTLELPVQRPDVEVPVIELFLDPDQQD